MDFNRLDLIVEDVPAATALFRDVVGLAVRFADTRFAKLDSGAVIIMLGPDAMAPTTPAAGIILHLQVADVFATVERARANGARVLLEPTHTDWGCEPTRIAGPEGIIIDLYRPPGSTG